MRNSSAFVSAQGFQAADGFGGSTWLKLAGGGPSYIDVAEQCGASYFDIEDAWDAATPTQRLAANQHVLDIAIANGDTMTLSVPFYRVDTDTFTAAEMSKAR